MLGGHDLVCDLLRSFGGRLELKHAPKSLGQAASAGDVRRISLLVENGVPVDMPDYDGRTALHLAATEGHLLAVYILLHRYACAVKPSCGHEYDWLCASVVRVTISSRALRIALDRRAITTGVRSYWCWKQAYMCHSGCHCLKDMKAVKPENDKCGVLLQVRLRRQRC